MRKYIERPKGRPKGFEVTQEMIDKQIASREKNNEQGKVKTHRGWRKRKDKIGVTKDT